MKRAKRLTRRERGTHRKAAAYDLPPGTLNRHWTRAINTIVRTESDPELALARKLGDEVAMLPFARHILKEREKQIAAVKRRDTRTMSELVAQLGDKARQVLGIDPASEADRG